MENVKYYLTNMFGFILSFGIIVIFLSILLDILFKNFKIDSKKIKTYGIFLGLDNNNILSISILFTKLLFILYLALVPNKMIYLYLIILIFLAILYNVINKRYLNIVFDIINSFIIYYSLLIDKLLFKYLIDVSLVWYVLVIGILVGIFIIVYSLYFFIVNSDYILKKNKYVRRRNDVQVS